MTEPVRRVAVLGPGGEDAAGATAGDVDVRPRDVDVRADDARCGHVRADDADLLAAVEEADARVSSLRHADAIVAVGGRAVSAAATAGVSAPILPVGVGRLGVDRPHAADAVRALLAGRWQRTAHPLCSVTVGADRSTRHRSVFDVTLMTRETARISEYAVSFPSGRSESFRGDGVVVATPLGSGGYADAAGAPALEPGSGLSITPIAPFRIHCDRWIAAERATLSIERDEEPIELTVDGTACGTVPPHEPIGIAVEDRFDLISMPAEGEDDGAADWKNSNESCTE